MTEVASKAKRRAGIMKIPKEEATKYLADVTGECVFRCCDGTVFKNMRELRDGLANMSEEAYVYHVGIAKNDFSRWVSDVIRDEKLALDLQGSASRAEATKRVGSRVATLSKK
jgi:hypothetical protein